MERQLEEIMRETDMEESIRSFASLQSFFKRYNKVLLDKLAIEKQKKSLSKENTFFKNLLKQ